MKILTAKQIQKVEQNAFDNGISEDELMFLAGKASFEKIVKYYGEKILSNKVLVVCGNGKNAGDGFVIAKMLKEYGSNPFIVLADQKPTIKEPLKYYNEAVEFGVQVVEFESADFDAALIVDCVFGIGFHGKAKPPFDSVFDAINASSAKVVSIDTPSGTNAENGEAISAVQADLTIAISTLKYAHVLPPSNSYCGKTVVVNIGIPEECYKEEYANTVSKADVKAMFKTPNKNANKGTLGRLVCICGSYLTPGAAVMCANGALRTGAGLVECVFPKSIYSVLTSHLYQSVFSPMTENEEKTISMGALTGIVEKLQKASAVVIGCGLGVNDDTQVIVSQVIKECKVPLIIDADGINCLSLSINILKDRSSSIILTPHPGEMARLVGKTIDEVQSDRIGIAKDFAKNNDVIVVLKGANTVITDGKKVFVNTNGNTSMAMGGTGDLLSGIIGSFAAQGMDTFSAAMAGVFVHGMCGDVTASELSKRGMTVYDMTELLGALMSEFE